MTDSNLTSQREKPQGWFFPGWATAHMASSFMAAIKRSWIAPIIFSLAMMSGWIGIRDEIFLVFFISLIIALIVSFVFSAIIYPFLQLAYRTYLQSASSGKETAWIMLPLQQLLIWSIAVGVVMTDNPSNFEATHPVLQFSTLVAFHAALQLFSYSIRMWRVRHSALTRQIPTFEHELATTNVARIAPGVTE